MRNIVFLDVKTVGNVPTLNRLKELGHVTFYETTTPQQVLERVSGQQIVITNKVVINRETIEQSPDLRLICVAATGTNNVDLEYARQKGIEVKNVSGYSTHSVTQVTFSILFYLLHQMRYYDDYVKTGGYARSDIFSHFGREFWELSGKNFGIIGLGTIGRSVAAIAEAFGANVLYFSTSGKNDTPKYQRVDLEELLQTSDVISIHSPLNENTRNLINYNTLRLMKKTAILVNTGRGGIVNEADLVRALNEDCIAAAGLDVLETEPIKADNVLLSVKNPDKLLITPHIAWATRESRTELIAGVCRNIEEWARKRE
jgi:lactate dehydrogenase-like 2-hydroxyacid dehydrogenase